MSSNKLQKRQARLFSTLASVEQTDKSASKRRKQSQAHSLQQSRAASDQTKLNGILLELRILTQRCLTEESTVDADANDDEVDVNNVTVNHDSRVKEEVDALLENLLVARRDLMGHQLHGVEDSGEEDDASNDDEKKKEVDYVKLIRQTNRKEDEHSSSDDDSSDDSDSQSNNNNSLGKQIQNEYASLQTHWKTILNKHHSKLALHSGMSVNSSKFQSKAVDVSFWEQVQGGMEHERFKQRSSNVTQEGGSGGTNGSGSSRMQFDDSKLYQQQLKDFISSSQANGSASAKTNKRGIAIDPAQEAAERLKRAMRKKTGGDVDLTSILNDAGVNSDGVIVNQNVNKKKVTVDRRASKGRKIRYTVNPKLVNFTFPVARPEPMIREDVWFKSLFGGVGNHR